MNLQSCPSDEPSDSECRPDREEGKGRKGSSEGDCFRQGTDLEGGREVSRRFDVGSPRQCQVKDCLFVQVHKSSQQLANVQDPSLTCKVL